MRWIAVSLPLQSIASNSHQATCVDDLLWQVCSQFSPTLVWKTDQHALSDTQQHHGILLEVEPSLRLFGGEARLAKSFWEALRCEPHVPWQVGCASTAQAAWWLSKALPCPSPLALGNHLLTPNAALRLLTSLSTNVLDIPMQKHKALIQCGLHTLGDIRKLPRDGLARRIGTEVLQMLDCAWEKQAQPHAIAQEKPVFQIKRSMPFHSTEQRLIEQLMLHMLQELEHWLTLAKLGSTELNWCFHLPNNTQILSLHSARLLQKSKDWQVLLHHRLSRLQFGDEVRDITLTCTQHKPLADQTLSLLPQAGQDEESWLALCDELRQRVGEHSVQFLSPLPDPRPECSMQISTEPINPKKVKQDIKPSLAASAQWPLMLLNKPERLRGAPPAWHNKQGWRLVSGPERVEFGWWADTPVSRDYYRAVNPEAVQAWIYQDLNQTAPTGAQWYLHGYFA